MFTFPHTHSHPHGAGGGFFMRRAGSLIARGGDVPLPAIISTAAEPSDEQKDEQKDEQSDAMTQKDEQKDEQSDAMTQKDLMKRVIDLQSENIRLRDSLDATRMECASVTERLREKTELLNLILEKDRRHSEQLHRSEYALECFASHVTSQSITIARHQTSTSTRTTQNTWKRNFLDLEIPERKHQKRRRREKTE